MIETITALLTAKGHLAQSYFVGTIVAVGVVSHFTWYMRAGHKEGAAS